MQRHIPAALTALSLQVAACGSGADVFVTASESTPGRGTYAATLSWSPPLSNTDGTALLDLIGYRVYRGSALGNLALVEIIPNPGITTVVVDDLGVGTHYFAVSAIASSDAESPLSEIRSKTIF